MNRFKFKLNYLLSFFYRILIVYLLYTIARIAFMLYNYHYYNDLELDELLWIFVGGLKFDTSAIVYTNILFILFYNLPIKYRYSNLYQKLMTGIFVGFNSLALFVNYADIPYFQYVLERSTFNVFKEFSNEDDYLGFAWTFIKDFWMILILYVISIYVLIFLYKRAVVELKSNSGIAFYIRQSAIFAIVLALSIGGIRGGFRHSTRPISLSDAGAYAKDANQMALVLNTPFSIIRTINSNSYKRLNYFSEEELSKIYSPISQIDSTKGDFKNKNVVIFILESFSREFIGSLNGDLDSGKYKGYTPFLDSLIAHSLTFETSLANGRKSIEALPSILTSTPSIGYPFVLSPYYNNNLTSLPGILKDYDYQTMLFHGAPNGSMGFQAFGNFIGIDRYYGMSEYNNNDDFDGLWGIWDEEFFQFFANELNKSSKPFMASIFSVSSHHPFKIPQKYEGKFLADDFPLQKCVRYTDNALREFFNTASKQDWFENTLFVFTADHVSVNHRPEFVNELGDFSVPIIFYTPSESLTKIDSTNLAQQIDIMPSVLDYLNYDKSYFSFGKSLFKPHENKFVVNFHNSYYRIFKGDYLMIHDGNKKISLYNYKIDKQSKNNILGQLPKIEDDLERSFKAYLQQYTNRMIDNDLKVKN